MNRFDVVVIGSGPSGLTAAYFLARAGAKVAVVERSDETGGLMRGVTRGEFSLDLGRKELYSRLPEIHALWSGLLGNDFRVYPHHVGLLSDGEIMERMSMRTLLSLSPSQQVRLLGDFLWAQVKPGDRLARNIEDYYLLRFGRTFYEFFNYGFTRKFHGSPLTDIPLDDGPHLIRRFDALWTAIARGIETSTDDVAQAEWRHPARGTSQIVDLLEAGAREAGATFILGAEAQEITVAERRARSVRLRTADGTVDIEAGAFICGIPLRSLVQLLRPGPPVELVAPPPNEVVFKKSTVLVYLMADHPPRFPHNWLEVNDMSFQVGRVVNYATWNTDMVPPGQAALCMEYFFLDGDGLGDLSESQFHELARTEATRAGLIDERRIFDSLVIKLTRVNAATQWLDWRVKWMQMVKEYLDGIANLYETNRPGMDRASLAGKDAADACRRGAPMSTRSLDTVVAHRDGGAPRQRQRHTVG